MKRPFIRNSMQIMKGLAVKEEIKKDGATRSAFEKLKRKTKELGVETKQTKKARSPNDWYKEYLEIHCTHSLDIWHKNKFPVLIYQVVQSYT